MLIKLIKKKLNIFSKAPENFNRFLEDYYETWSDINKGYFEIGEKKHSINLYWEYTDVYSYGMVLYELFNGGSYPFYNIQDEQVFSKFDYL